MKTAIILHGMPSKEEYFSTESHAQSNKHWLAWVQGELVIHGIVAQTPEMPKPYEPVYEDWKNTFEQFPINEDTLLIGHSCGAGFLVRYLSENKIKVGKVVLVAPWIDIDHELPTGFFEGYEIDPDLVTRTAGLAIFYSSDDDEEILKTVEQLKLILKGAEVRGFSDRGHFTLDDMKTEKFPELLEEVLK